MSTMSVACVTVMNVSVFKGQELHSWLAYSRQLAFQTVRVVPGQDIRSVICFMLCKQSCGDDSQKHESLTPAWIEKASGRYSL